MKTTNIKAILFDSGDTLCCPASGHWFIPPNFTSLFNSKLGGTDSERMRKAFEKAYAYLDAHHCLETEEQEYDQFITFFKIWLTEAKYPHITEDLLVDLAQDTVYNDDKFSFFDDVFVILPKLHDSFLLGIISDTWPSLERVFRRNALRKYFSTFVMSSALGICKPHHRMYQAALEELQLAPHEALFVDDNLLNLEGAAALGLQAVLIDRYHKAPPGNEFPIISDLHELLPLLES